MFMTSKDGEPVEIASRNSENEKILCDAIRNRRLVSFRYKNDLRYREFAPIAVYRSPIGKVCASGEVIKNYNNSLARLGPHNFEIGLMYGLTLTLDIFVPDTRFRRSDAKYRSGIICSVCI